MNGSGKTTLLRSLVGELACLSGEVYQQPRTLVHLSLSQCDLLYYIYIYIYTHTHIHTHLYLHLYLHLNLYLHLYLHLYLYLYTAVCAIRKIASIYITLL